MHIPDAFLPLPHAVLYWAIACVFIVLALRWSRNGMSDENVPFIAVLSAGIFAIQAFNLPVGMGTSGHLIGGALAAIVLGSPYAGIFVLTIVVILQGVIFGDGGITSMGANIINMGVIGGFVGYYGYIGVKKISNQVYLSVGIAAWAACFIAALACALEMALAGTFPLVPGMIAMGLYHAVIGVIEGVITAGALFLIMQARPDILAEQINTFKTKSNTLYKKGKINEDGIMEHTVPKKSMNMNLFIITGLLFAFLIGSGAVFFASDNPDGLESTSLFVQNAKKLFGESPEDGDPEAIGTGTFEFKAPIPDYTLGRGNGVDVFVALFGILLTFIVIFGLARVFQKS